VNPAENSAHRTIDTHACRHAGTSSRYAAQRRAEQGYLTEASGPHTDRVQHAISSCAG